MNVLLVNKFYRRQGGAETVFFMTKDLLEAEGHDVVPFAMRHPENVATEWGDCFSRSRSYVEGPVLARVRDSGSAIYSIDARRALRRLLARFEPDIAHLHNVYHQLSVSVVDELRRAGIPMVMTLHDYKLVCPNYSLFTHGERCERCVGASPWHVVRRRCVKNSVAGSFVAALEASLVRAFDRYRPIARFIVPSEFMRRVVVEGGIDETRVTVIRYPVASQPIGARKAPTRPTFLFAGRFSPEKGVDTLLSASAMLRGNALVRLVGRGPLEDAFRRRVAAERLPVELAPFVDNPEQLRQEIRSATAVVVPSVSYENAPMAILEAAAVGVPSVASRIGGIPEIVNDGVTGILVRPGDPASLARALEMVAADVPFAASLGKRAWMRVRSEHDAYRHVTSVVSCYTDVLGRRVLDTPPQERSPARGLQNLGVPGR